ncbi:hypothetical protein RHMOL_Rhmol05G0121600 [Rhododendron molle]|uniref:Uncharacterized protein n=1 Tax=Rhododendron molle TaxID=49168 RepID=A0ACC0NQB0_RHOML|nr:hypothetical protein RHMOL_Rhmol05G0121600 [Rhododendron molle]
MCKVWGRQEDKRVKVSFSDKGQPISNNCILSHFLGTIARNGKYAPLHYKSWPKMPQVYKDNMFSLVLNVNDKNKDSTIYRMGKTPLAIVREAEVKNLGHDRVHIYSLLASKTMAMSQMRNCKKKKNKSSNGGNTLNIPVTSQNQQIGSSTSFSQLGRVKVGDYVNFKSVANPTDVVGKGRIASTNPSIEVGDYVNFKSVANPTNVVGKGRITGTDPSIEKMAYAAVCNAIIGRWNGFRSICSGTEKCLDK